MMRHLSSPLMRISSTIFTTDPCAHPVKRSPNALGSRLLALVPSTHSSNLAKYDLPVPCAPCNNIAQLIRFYLRFVLHKQANLLKYAVHVHILKHC